MSKYTLELDCKPGNPRPGDLLDGVLKDTGIKLGEPTSKLFGHWIWAIPKEHEAQYEQWRAIIQQRITNLHERGLIRYGSW